MKSNDIARKSFLPGFCVLGVLVAMSLQVNSSQEPLFAADLYKAMGKDGNLVFSPYSIQSCLGLVCLAAGGETATELARGLRFGSMTKHEIAKAFAQMLEENGSRSLMKISNKVFLNTEYEISDAFGRLSKMCFDASIENMDFSKSTESEKSINDWVEKDTNGMIKDVLPPGAINGDTSALLVNVIYFKGEWEAPFSANDTLNMTFYSTSSDKVTTAFMNQKDYFAYGDVQDLDATAIEMPYMAGDFSMVIVLPNQVDGLAGLAAKVQNNYDLIKISDKLTLTYVDLSIPKFEIEYQVDLDQPLSKLGIQTMFTNQADFHYLLKRSASPLKVSKILHKAAIKVDEAGSEAAAATGKICF